MNLEPLKPLKDQRERCVEALLPFVQSCVGEAPARLSPTLMCEGGLGAYGFCTVIRRASARETATERVREDRAESEREQVRVSASVSECDV